MDKGLNKFFKAVVNELNNSLPNLGESISEVSHFILEPSNFAVVTILPEDVKRIGWKKPWKRLKSNQQSDLSNGWPREGTASETMYGCL